MAVDQGFEVYRKGSYEGLSLTQKTGVGDSMNVSIYHYWPWSLPFPRLPCQRITKNNGDWSDFLTVIVSRVGTRTQVSPQWYVLSHRLTSCHLCFSFSENEDRPTPSRVGKAWKHVGELQEPLGEGWATIIVWNCTRWRHSFQTLWTQKENPVYCFDCSSLEVCLPSSTQEARRNEGERAKGLGHKPHSLVGSPEERSCANVMECGIWLEFESCNLRLVSEDILNNIY